MDFVTDLNPVGPERYDAVLVIADRYSRCVMMIPTHKKAGAETTARLFLRHCISYTGLPRRIISDRDARFMCAFWQTLHALLGTRLSPSTAYQSQTDGLAERSIGSLEEALRTFCGYGFNANLPDAIVNWADLLPALAFAYNSSVHKSTQQIPFLLERGYVPRGILDAIKDALPLRRLKPSKEGTTYAKMLESAATRAKESLHSAFEQMKSRWDKSHKERSYEPGDLVRVSTKYMSFKGIHNKMKQAFLGPFKVIEMVGSNAVRVQLDEVHKDKHNVFNVSKVQPFNESSEEAFPGRRPNEIEVPPIISDEGDELYEVELIRQKRKAKDGGFEYLVHWKNYGVEYDEWITTDKIHATELIEQFEKTESIKTARNAQRATKGRKENPPSRLQPVRTRQ